MLTGKQQTAFLCMSVGHSLLFGPLLIALQWTTENNGKNLHLS